MTQVTVGEWQLEAFVGGRLLIPEWECFFGRNDCTLREIVFYVVVMRCGDQIGLIDAGVPLDEPSRRYLDEACQGIDPESYFRDVSLLPEILDMAGIAPSEIDFLMITQPITYATGGMVSHMFPRAQVYMAQAGLEEFLYESVGHPPREAYFTAESWAFLHEAIIQGRLTAVADAVQVAPGVEFVVTGGHHPGSAAVSVEGDGAPVTLVETAFLQENVETDTPIGIAESTAAARSAVRRFRQAGHRTLAFRDPDLMDNLRKAAG